MLHSKVAILSWVQAARTMLTARISSDVSITMMGVEELMRTFRRSSLSVMSFKPFRHQLHDGKPCDCPATGPGVPLHLFDQSRVAPL